jgi:hypothetical protein
MYTSENSLLLTGNKYIPTGKCTPVFYGSYSALILNFMLCLIAIIFIREILQGEHKVFP